MPDAVLALNAGSSSIKFALFEVAPPDGLRLLSRGAVDGIGTAPQLRASDAAGKILAERRWPEGDAVAFAALLGQVLDFVDAHLAPDLLIGVGHRVVHGGPRFTAPVRIDASVLAALAALTPLAPLHQPHSLAPMHALATLRPGLAQIACFDTAFHATMPAVATRFALPRGYADEGVRRYGFHGLSYEYIARELRRTAPALAAGRVVVAHLGNGASLCAMRDASSVDTTMGLTALDGLVMGTRCGDIDPGVLLYMLQQKGMSPHDVEQTLYQRSGLLGVSGLSSDMRTLAASATVAAREALELFVYRIASQTAAMASALGGLDGFVFTAGIGEHAPDLRAAVGERLRWLGARIDTAANAAHATRISAADSTVDVRVIATDEEAMIARHAMETLAAG